MNGGILVLPISQCTQGSKRGYRPRDRPAAAFVHRCTVIPLWGERRRAGAWRVDTSPETAVSEVSRKAPVTQSGVPQAADLAVGRSAMSRARPDAPRLCRPVLASGTMVDSPAIDSTGTLAPSNRARFPTQRRACGARTSSAVPACAASARKSQRASYSLVPHSPHACPSARTITDLY